MKTQKFDVVDFLENHAMIDEYLQAVLTEGGSLAHLAKAFADAERARAKLESQEPNLKTVAMIFDALSTHGYCIQQAEMA